MTFFSTDYFEADINRSTFYMRRHQGAKVKHFDVSNVIYHKFSHGAVSYTLNGETVNVMLEYLFLYVRTGSNKFSQNYHRIPDSQELQLYHESKYK